MPLRRKEGSVKQKQNKEHPILFSGPMVKALLDGRKTQTRRPVKPQPENCKVQPKIGDIHCPFGGVGDRLWVRETYKIVPVSAYSRCSAVEMKINPDDDLEVAVFRCGWERSPGGIPWRPSIFMPRWASRIQLEIMKLTVHRLQDITELQAQAEGAAPLCLSESYRDAFRRLWDGLHKPYGLAGWDANPWVWAIEFKRIDERK